MQTRSRWMQLLYRWRWVLLAFVSSRFIIFGLMKLSKMIIVGGEYWNRKGGVISVLTSWDGAKYIEIAERGYSGAGDHTAALGFLPLYPAVVWLVSLVLQNAAVSAVLVSNILLLGAGILLKELLDREYHEPRISRTAVMFLMFSPVSFFFSSAYSESLFLVLSLGAFFAATRRSWLVACLCGMAAAATQPVGFLITVPLLVEFWRAPRVAGENAEPRGGNGRIFLFALIPLGGALFLLFAQLRFGDALAPLRASELWRRGVVPPWEGISSTEPLRPFYYWFAPLALGIGVLLLAAGAWLRLRLSYLIYAALLIAAFAFCSNLLSVARYLSVVFPLYIVLALLSMRYRWAHEPLLACSFSALAFCTVLAANGYWMR